MEKALLLSPSEAERLTPPKTTGAASGAPVLFHAMIVGSEFCHNQLPSPAALQRLLKLFPGTSLVLATAILTDKALPPLEKLLQASSAMINEVIVNDFGVFQLLENKFRFKLSLGRLLAREFALMDPAWAKSFLKARGVHAVEADTPVLAAMAVKLGLKVSWHRPMTFTAVTTFCPFEKHFKARCRHSCEGKLEKLSNPHLPLPLFLAEKAYFCPRPENAGLSKKPWRDVITLNFLRHAGIRRR